MGKVFKIESNKQGLVAGLLGGASISLLLFLILPLTQQLTGSNPKNLLLKVNVTLPTKFETTRQRVRLPKRPNDGGRVIR